MAGVEILNQIEVTDTQTGIGFGWVLAIALGVFLLISILGNFDEFCMVLGAIAAAGIAIMVIFATIEEVPTGEYQYEVIVNEEVNLQEFYDYYDVVEQRGEIFVVEERTTE